MSLYMEATDSALEVFVTDQGAGFAVNDVSGDRKGISESIRARMERVGGQVEIGSEMDEGTEVMLRLPT